MARRRRLVWSRSEERGRLGSRLIGTLMMTRWCTVYTTTTAARRRERRLLPQSARPHVTRRVTRDAAAARALRWWCVRRVCGCVGSSPQALKNRRYGHRMVGAPTRLATPGASHHAAGGARRSLGCAPAAWCTNREAGGGSSSSSSSTVPPAPAVVPSLRAYQRRGLHRRTHRGKWHRV